MNFAKSMSIGNVRLCRKYTYLVAISFDNSMLSIKMRPFSRLCSTQLKSWGCVPIVTLSKDRSYVCVTSCRLICRVWWYHHLIWWSVKSDQDLVLIPTRHHSVIFDDVLLLKHLDELNDCFGSMHSHIRLLGFLCVHDAHTSIPDLIGSLSPPCE